MASTCPRGIRRRADALWTEACGKDRWLESSREKTESLERGIGGVSDEKLWQFRSESRKLLIEYARRRLAGQLAASGESPEAIEGIKRLFDPNTLTLGFARRFATYKRPDLLLHDPARLLRILTNAQWPVQLIIAGKAHPADQAGQDFDSEMGALHPAARSAAARHFPGRLRHAAHRKSGCRVWMCG